jgi:4-amino-4-deoxy-L-arabinose transferase-like glycosyltransferase
MSVQSSLAELTRPSRTPPEDGEGPSPAEPAEYPGDFLPSPRRETLSWGLAALFLVVAGVTLFFNLGGVHTLGSHEAYAAVPAREMLQTGNWTIPYFAGVPRLTKPPLVYWMLASLGTVFGRFDEGLARLPEAIAALLLALLMARWATRWYGRAAGWSAAFVQVTALYVLTYGRKVDVDMTVWLFITTALYLIAHQPRDESRGRSFLRWAVIGASIAISWLGKFHYGPVMIVAPTVIFFLIQKRPWHVFRFLNPVGLLLIAAAVFIWPWLVLQQLPGAWDLWYAETVGRAVGNKGYDPIWYFAPVVLMSMLPWTSLVIAGVRGSWRRAWKEGNANERFLWVWFLTHFVIVSLQPNKHVHYVNSALPALTLLAAQVIPRFLKHMQSGSNFVGIRPALLTTLAIVPAMAALGVFLGQRWPAIAGTVAAATAIIAAGVSLGGWLAAFGRFRPAGLAYVATFLGAFIVVHGWVLPNRDKRLATAEFARETREIAGPSTMVVTYRLGQHSSTYYLDAPTHRVEKLDALNELVRKNGRVFVMTTQPFSGELQHVPHQRLVRLMQPNPDIPPPKHAPFVLLEIRSEESAKQLAARTARGPRANVR